MLLLSFLFFFLFRGGGEVLFCLVKGVGVGGQSECTIHVHEDFYPNHCQKNQQEEEQF